MNGQQRIIFKCPPGTRGIYVDNTTSGTSMSHHVGEREVILPRNMKVKILEVKKSSMSPFVSDIVLEVIPDV